jgi:hypothetical protein
MAFVILVCMECLVAMVFAKVLLPREFRPRIYLQSKSAGHSIPQGHCNKAEGYISLRGRGF